MLPARLLVLAIAMSAPRAGAAAGATGGDGAPALFLFLIFMMPLACYCVTAMLLFLICYALVPDIHDAHDSLLLLHVLTRSPYTVYAMIIVLAFWIKICRFMTIFPTPATPNCPLLYPPLFAPKPPPWLKLLPLLPCAAPYCPLLDPPLFAPKPLPRLKLLVE